MAAASTDLSFLALARAQRLSDRPQRTDLIEPAHHVVWRRRDLDAQELGKTKRQATARHPRVVKVAVDLGRVVCKGREGVRQIDED